MNCLSTGSTLQNGKYEIVKVLGQGGFGITYLAVHTFLDKKVAIKEFFPKDFCDRNETTSQITLGTANTAELVSKLKVKSKKTNPSKVDSSKDNSIIDDCKFVDLGLSVLWASQNMGAKRPEDLGTFVNKRDVTTASEVLEWNLKGALAPTIGQFEELRNNCNWEWTEQKGVGGYKITGRTGNSIFIPFSGDNKNNSFRIFGRLFTRESLYNDSPAGQYYLYFSHGDYKLAKYACDYICPVRLIKQK